MDHSPKEIGAFEAKTQFSRLLREVGRGAVYEVTHRGRKVARLVPADDLDPARDNPEAALRRLRSHAKELTREEILALRDEGRER